MFQILKNTLIKNRLIFSVLVIVFTLTSCSFDTPENYFDRTTLNTNSLVQFGKKDFQLMSPSGTYVEHIKNSKLLFLNNDIEKIESLIPTDDTKDMIEASLKVYSFVKTKYETDYIEIAKLYDAKTDKAVINKRIEQFENENLEEFNKRLNALWNIAMPYAKENGIKVNSVNTY